jgi:ABC-2 type transport system permease protein
MVTVRRLLTYGAIGADFWFTLFGALAILAVFIPLTLYAYKRKA